MPRNIKILPAWIVIALVLPTAATAAAVDGDGATPEAADPETSRPQEPAPKPELTPAMAALRDRVRQTVALYRRQPLSVRENTATELMHYCLAFGCNSEVYGSGPAAVIDSAQKVNGITCLCWNHPCLGYEPLALCEGHVAARIGYGLQERPSQLLAVLALSRVPVTYPMRVGETARTVADLVESEKLSCRSGADLSLKLIGLVHYVVDEPTWENSLGEEWSIDRIIKEELARPDPFVLDGSAADEGTQRLLGLSYALDRRAKRKQPPLFRVDGGQFRRAQEFVDEFHDYALKLQNRDGSWGPQFLAAKGSSRDPATQLRSTGHVLEWLAMSLPEYRLEDPQVVRSVELVNGLLSNHRFRRNLRSMKTRDISAVMHALHALTLYDKRFFEPRTPKQPTPEVTQQAAR